MSESQLLASILSEDDLKLIPINLQTTVNCFLESKSKISEIEKQRYSLLEKDYNDLKTKVGYQSELVSKYKAHVTELEDELHKSRRELCDSNHEKDCMTVELKNLKLEIESKDSQLAKFDELIKTKNEETVKLIESNHKLRIDLEQAKRDFNTSDVNEEHFSNLLDEKEKLFNLECGYFRSELERVSSDFLEKCTSFNKLNSTFSNYKNETELQLIDLKKENNSLKSQYSFLSNQVEKKDIQINELAVKVNELHQHQDLLKEQYSIEKKEHDDLINYYKKVLEDTKKVKVDLISKIKELHTSFTESNENQKALQDRLNHLKMRHSEEIEQQNEFIINLQQKIEQLKSQLISMSQKERDDAARQFYPTSNTLSKMMDKNMSISTVYNKYEELEIRFEAVIRENDELRSKIQDMIAESERNAPLIFYKTQENKKAYAELEEYKNQLSKVSSNLENALSEIENSDKISNYLKRELRRYEKSNIDLTRQVQHLVQVVHEIKGNFVPTKFLVNDEFLDKESEFDREISLNLVTFKNIEEIHGNNQKLLSTLRELSDQYNELQDKYNNRDDDEDSRKRIDQLLIEIENLKEENRHKQEILSEMMSESKLNQSGKHDTSIGKDKQTTGSMFKITSRAYLEEKIAELTHNLEKRNTEFEQFKIQSNTKEDQLKNDIKNHLEQITNYQNEISKLSVQLNSLNENNKILESTLARYNKDIDLLKERNIKLEEQRKTLKERIATFESKKNELVAKVNETKKELDSLNKSTNVLEKENAHLKAENNLMKQRIDELKSDLKETERELGDTKTEYEVGAVKNEIELKNKIQMLEMNVSNLQSNIATLTNERNAINEKYLEHQKQCRLTITSIKQKALNATNEGIDIAHERDILAKKLKELQDKLKEVEQSADSTANNKNKTIKIQLDLRNQIEEKRKEIMKLNEEKKQLSEKLIEKENALKQATTLSNLKIQQIQQLQQEVDSKVAVFKRQIEESQLRERILKNKYESKLKAVSQENCDLKIKLSTAESQQQEKDQQQFTSTTTTAKQDKESQPTTSKQLNTATIKPLTVLNRPQPQTTTSLPQAAVTPTQTLSTSISTSSPQTAYVVPTSVEVVVSSSENSSTISSSPALQSFAIPSTSSSLLPSITSNLPSNIPSHQQQSTSDFPSMDSSSSSNNLKKRQRNVINFEDLKVKKPKINLIEQAIEQIVDPGENNPPKVLDQVTIETTTINEQQQSQLDESKTKTEATVLSTTESTSEPTKESTVESENNLMIDDQRPTTSENLTTEQQETLSMPVETEIINQEIEDEQSQDQQLVITDQIMVDRNEEEQLEEDKEIDDEESENNSEEEFGDEEEGGIYEEEGGIYDEDESMNEDEEDQDSNEDMNDQQDTQEYKRDENSQSQSNTQDQSSDIICLSDENSGDSKAEMNDERSNQNSNHNNLDEQQEANQAAAALDFMFHSQIFGPQSHIQLNEPSTSSHFQNDSSHLQNLSMPIFASLSRAVPVSTEEDTYAGENLMIDEQASEEQSEKPKEESEETNIIKTIHSTESTIDPITESTSTANTTAEQPTLMAISVINLPESSTTESTSSQAQSIADQTPSSTADQPSNQTRRIRNLKRPNIAKTSGDQQKDKQNE